MLKNSFLYQKHSSLEPKLQVKFRALEKSEANKRLKNGGKHEKMLLYYSLRKDERKLLGIMIDLNDIWRCTHTSLFKFL